ncbi:MAG TPA: hypothetical protein VFM46_14785 [Pseudomonadales bacterium]|nr:hypothetical protein [Pseudomonadales bacterium]
MSADLHRSGASTPCRIIFLLLILAISVWSLKALASSSEHDSTSPPSMAATC